MKRKRARLIYNPTSGREEGKKRLPDLLAVLEKGGFETSCHATEGDGDAADAAALAVEHEFDVVIAAGGDGTIHEVINGLADQERRPSLGIIPLGTTNDFARALGIPRHWRKAAELIVRGHQEVIDLGKVNDRYFINIAGGGSMTELTYEVPSKLKTVLGQLAYYMKGLEKLPRLRPIHLKIESKEQRFDGEAMLFLVANSNSVGGFEKLAPDARMNDGLLDVLILKKCHLADFVRAVTLALRGEHIHDKNVIYFQTDHMEIYSPDYTQLNLDGELGGTLPCHVSVLPSHLHIFTDQTGHSTYHERTELSDADEDRTQLANGANEDDEQEDKI